MGKALRRLAPMPAGGTAEPLCSPPPSQTSQAAAGARGTAAHMDPIRAEIIPAGSLAAPCTGEGRQRWDPGAAQGCGAPRSAGCCLGAAFGARGAAPAGLTLPAQSKGKPFSRCKPNAWDLEVSETQQAGDPGVL